MKKLIAYIPAHLIYYLGHLCSKIGLGMAYQRLMLWSVAINDWADLEIWKDPDDAPELTKEWFEKADRYENGRLVRKGTGGSKEHDFTDLGKE